MKLIVESLVCGICMSVRESLFIEGIIWKEQNDYSLVIFAVE